MAGGSRTSSGSNNNYKFRKKVLCNCGGFAVLRTVKQGPNAGRKFHVCPKWQNTNCKFMEFFDENNEMRSEMEELRFNVFERDVIVAEMEYNRELNEEKIKKLELKNASLKEENKQLKQQISEMRVELMRSTTNEKHFSVALMLSWFFLFFTNI